MKKNKTYRQKQALNFLREQLTSGTKTQKKGFDKVPLDENDKKRIRKEIKTLESKTKGE